MHDGGCHHECDGEHHAQHRDEMRELLGVRQAVAKGRTEDRNELETEQRAHTVTV